MLRSSTAAAGPDLAVATRDLVRYRQEHLTGDEKGEGQIFLEHLFQAFGHAGLRQAGQESPGDEHHEPLPVPAPAVADQPPPRGHRRRRRSGPQIRVTVDLDRDTHRALRQLALDTDADASEIIWLLIGRALRDPHSAEAIRAELDELA